MHAADPITRSVEEPGKTPSAAPAGSSLAGFLAPLFLIVSLFFMWGVANNLNDILIRQFKKAFELTDLQSGLVQSAFYMGYFLLALPAGMFMRSFGYRPAVVLGLMLYALGAFLFYPAAAAQTYSLFLLALFVIASGLAFLETSANPLMTVLGPAEGAERRLNFAQAFNPLGSITGVLVGRFFIFSGHEPTAQELAAMSDGARAAYHTAESAAVQGPYLVIGAIAFVWAILVAAVRFPPLQEDSTAHGPDVAAANGSAPDAAPLATTAAERGAGQHAPGANLTVGSQLSSLFRRKQFLAAVAAQFFYVGAQVGVWSYLIRYAQATIPGMPERTASDYLTASLVAFMIGRFAGTAAMRSIAPARLLAVFAAVNVILTALAVALPGQIGLYCLVGCSFFMSIMFPTIFALGVRDLGPERKLGSSFLVMAIIGGAVLTAAMGALSDATAIHVAITVPAVCFAVVLGYAVRSGRAARAAA